MTLNLCQDHMQQPIESILSLSLNQDHSCVAVGTDKGFKIINLHPFKIIFHRGFSNGIGICEMLFRCNLLALVGGGKNPAYEENIVKIWDDNQIDELGELKFKGPVKAVKLRKDMIFVSLKDSVVVFSIHTLKSIKNFDEVKNDKGLMSISAEGKSIVAFPGKLRGEVRVENITDNTSIKIKAHDHEISCFSLNHQGTLLATASTKGTLVRIFDTKTGKKLQELRRGTKKAIIYSISFSKDSKFICTTSDKGTVHVFVCKGQIGEQSKTKNRTTPLQIVGGYFKSEWSFAWYKGPECPSICCFGNDNKSLVQITADGSCIRLSMNDQKGGQCIQRKLFKFFKMKEKSENPS